MTGDGVGNGTFVRVDELAALDVRDADTAAPLASWLGAARSYRCRLYPLVTAAPEGRRR